MDLTGEQLIPASRDEVWQALNDPEVLRQCIPGCDSMEKTSDTDYVANVTAKVGPVKAKFTGAVSLSNLNPPDSFTLAGEGKGGPAGFAKGSADITLTEQDGGTLLSYTVKADLGGKLAQLGARLIDGVAKKMAGDFFSRLNGILAGGEEEAAAPEAAPAAAEAPGGMSPMVWATGLIIAVLIVLLYFAYT